MEYTKILFSKEHLASPFTLIQKNIEISIADKKTRTIALSILVGIFSFGIGGVIFFYCLSAKYKLERLKKFSATQGRINSIIDKKILNINKNENKNLNFENNYLEFEYAAQLLADKMESELPNDETSWKNLKCRASKLLANKLSDEEYIDLFVESYLHPTLDIDLFDKSNDWDKKPFIDIFLQSKRQFKDANPAKTKEMAWNTFFKKGALSLYNYGQKDPLSKNLMPGTKDFSTLVDKLEAEMKKQFPNAKTDSEYLHQKAHKELKHIANQKLIDDWVASFLDSYIRGYITKETDPKDRKPMIELLCEKMVGLGQLSRTEIENMALKAFFEKSALGLYIYEGKRGNSGDIISLSPKFEKLLQALTEAIPREFPNYRISQEELRKRAIEGLANVNRERHQIEAVAKDWITRPIYTQTILLKKASFKSV